MAKTKERLKRIHNIETENPGRFLFSYDRNGMIQSNYWSKNIDYIFINVIEEKLNVLEEARFEAKHCYEDLLEAKQQYHNACQKDLPKGDERDKYIASFRNSYIIVRDRWKSLATKVIEKRALYKNYVSAYNKFQKIVPSKERSVILTYPWRDKVKSLFTSKDSMAVYNNVIAKLREYKHNHRTSTARTEVKLEKKDCYTAILTESENGAGWITHIDFHSLWYPWNEFYHPFSQALSQVLNVVWRRFEHPYDDLNITIYNMREDRG